MYYVETVLGNYVRPIVVFASVQLSPALHAD